MSLPVPTIKPKNGRMWLWGINSYGQLGDNTTIYRSSPVQTVALGSNWNQISLFSYHALSIKDDGSLWAWGFNNNGQLGDLTLVNKSSPVRIGVNTDWVSVSAGYLHSLAIKSNGTLWGWGSNNFGQLPIVKRYIVLQESCRIYSNV